jgi:hypothetical protein
MKTIYQLISLIIFFALLSMNFRPPTQQAALQAIGKFLGV